MIEIIPNWHPIFVHFPLALLSVAVGFFVLAAVARRSRAVERWLTFAHWNLWLGAGFAVVAALTGWLAYNSVAHDAASHAAMTDHRNWAIGTLLLFVPLAAWSAWWRYRGRQVGTVFVLLTVVGFVGLVSTGWRGGEAVFRYGVGVMALPNAAGDGHGHDHEHAQAPAPPGPPQAAGAPSISDMPEAAGDGERKVHVHKDGRAHEH